MERVLDLISNPDTNPEIKISEFFTNYNNNDSLVNDLIGLYQSSLSSTLEEFLFEIVIHPSLSENDRYVIICSLYTELTTSAKCSDTMKSKLLNILKGYTTDTSVKEISIIRKLLELGYFDDILCARLIKFLNTSILENVKYQELLDMRTIACDEFMKVGMLHLFKIGSSRQKILCSQYLLDKDIEVESIFSTLHFIASNEFEEYNTRADAADLVHHYFTGERQHAALLLLKELGGNSRDIYDNSQNIHNVDISEGISLLKDLEPNMSFIDISKYLTDKYNSKNLASSLGRIVVDLVKYNNMTSDVIFEKLWTFINNSSEKNELEKRLVEELEEMADTCSSGHAIRLINVLSGYGADIHITFKEQIESNIKGRMERDIRAIEDDDLRDKVISDMTDFGDNFMAFFIKNVYKIIDELYDEFVPTYISESEFDEYVSDCISKYTINAKSTSDLKFKDTR